MGVHFAKAALAAGHAVVATGRRPEAVTEAVGASDDLHVVKLDVISLADAKAAGNAAVARFGRIDPAKLAKALITIASAGLPPRRFIAGADSIANAASLLTSTI